MTLKAALEQATENQHITRTSAPTKYVVKTTDGLTEEETEAGHEYLVKYVSDDNETVRGGDEIVIFSAKQVQLLDTLAAALLADDWTLEQ